MLNLGYFLGAEGAPVVEIHVAPLAGGTAEADVAQELDVGKLGHALRGCSCSGQDRGQGQRCANRPSRPRQRFVVGHVRAPGTRHDGSSVQAHQSVRPRERKDFHCGEG